MIEKTDLEGVKKEAIFLLELPIERDYKFDFLVTHGFTSYRMTAIKNESGENEIVDLLENKEAREKWRKQCKELIESCDNAVSVYFLITKVAKIGFLTMIEKYLDIDDLATITKDAWQSIEFISDLRIYKEDFLRIFKKIASIDRSKIMNKEELKQYNQLPDEVVIYRGVSSSEAVYKKGLSWTISEEQAIWFSKRWKEVSKEEIVYCSTIKKDNILAFFNYENEVVVDPDKLGEITIK